MRQCQTSKAKQIISKICDEKKASRERILSESETLQTTSISSWKLPPKGQDIKQKIILRNERDSHETHTSWIRSFQKLNNIKALMSPTTIKLQQTPLGKVC